MDQLFPLAIAALVLLVSLAATRSAPTSVIVVTQPADDSRDRSGGMGCVTILLAIVCLALLIGSGVSIGS